MLVTGDVATANLQTHFPAKGLSPSAYPMWPNCSWELYSNLAGSTKFVNIDKRIHELNLYQDHQLTAEQQATHATVLPILERMSLAPGLRICYKVCTYGINWTSNGCVNLSHELLDAVVVQRHEPGILGNTPCIPAIMAVVFNLTPNNLAVAFSHLTQ